MLALIAVLSGTANAQTPFPVLNENFYNPANYPTDLEEVMIPASPFIYDVLFTGGVDSVYQGGQWSYANEWQDFTAYVPINGRSDSGYVVVNHERINTDNVLGDGGGMTVFTAYKDQNERWHVAEDANGYKFRNVDFSSVGGTFANCGGIQTSWGQVWTAEEWCYDNFPNNASVSTSTLNTPAMEALYSWAWDPSKPGGFSDTSDYTVQTVNGQTVNQAIPFYQNFSYMVEVDVENATAIRKNYNMGRYAHEGGYVMDDRKTVYLTDDASSGSVFFKFVADVAEDFSQGQLYAYQQGTNGNGGAWLPMTMDLNNMLYTRDSALALGATIFMRLEWVEGVDGKIYITETGRGKQFDVSAAITKGGTLAYHLQIMDDSDGLTDGKADDLYGRVLQYDPTTENMIVFLEGGDGNGVNSGMDTTGNHLASPDGLASTEINGIKWLVINEDMNPSGSPASPASFGKKLNEIYFLDITDGMPKNVSDLKRFAVGPRGCETTGGRFTPDGMTYFVNIQHPSTSGTIAPFDHSVTLAITGFNEYLTNLSTDEWKNEDNFTIYPNPSARTVYMNKTTDIAIYDVNGKRILVQRNVSQFDISNLEAGTYFLTTAEGQSKKLIVQ